MMEENKEFEKQRESLLVFIWKKRKVIGIVTFSALAFSIVVSLLLTPIFKSTAIVFPAATSTVSFSEQRNAKASSMDFGEDEQTEQLVQILHSSRVRDIVVNRFNLFEHYRIKQDDPNKYHKLVKMYNNNIEISPTRYGSVKIEVYDRNAILAAEIANKIVDLIDTVKNEMIKERTIPAFEINQRKKEILESNMRYLSARLDSLSSLGVVPSEGRANLFQAYNDAKSPADKIFFKEKIDINLQFGTKFDGISMLRDEHTVKLSKFEDSYEQAESDANTEFNHKFVVERAVVADKKDKPKRLVVVLMFTLAAFIFIVISLLIQDRIRELRKLA
jgi:uncharacterized protein involved in exopolysaccharide biosynthesis